MGRRSVTYTLGALVAALFSAAPGLASTPTEGSGGGTIVVRSITEIRQADGNSIQERHIDGVLTGTFDGTFDEVVRGVVHKSGMVTFHGTMTFTGVAGDCGIGTVQLELQGKGVAGAPVTEGRIRTIDQGGNTVKVHVIGTFVQTATAFTYEGQFHCD